ncbi:MAG TPA: hypothetical protein VG889_19450 [Rhizomicrobium sp.]|nr:hypothetical protein [Rhizomicrobium sp.]
MSAGPVHALSFATYDTGNNSELLTSLPGDDVKRVVFSVNVGSVNAGDILVVDAETEMTNDTGSPSRLTAQLILGSSASATTGTELDENNNFYITPDMHHGVRVKASIKGFSSSSSSTYVNLVVWGNPGTLTVEQDYGRLQVLKITP